MKSISSSRCRDSYNSWNEQKRLCGVIRQRRKENAHKNENDLIYFFSLHILRLGALHLRRPLFSFIWHRCSTDYEAFSPARQGNAGRVVTRLRNPSSRLFLSKTKSQFGVARRRSSRWTDRPMVSGGGFKCVWFICGNFILKLILLSVANGAHRVRVRLHLTTNEMKLINRSSYQQTYI